MSPQLVVLQLPVEGGATDAECLCGVGDVVGGRLQRLLKRTAFGSASMPALTMKQPLAAASWNTPMIARAGAGDWSRIS